MVHAFPVQDEPRPALKVRLHTRAELVSVPLSLAIPLTGRQILSMCTLSGVPLPSLLTPCVLSTRAPTLCQVPASLGRYHGLCKLAGWRRWSSRPAKWVGEATVEKYPLCRFHQNWSYFIDACPH